MATQMRIAVAAAIVTVVAVAAFPCAAQDVEKFPSKPVRLVTVGVGSQNDIVTRLIGAKMSEIWNQPVVVENRMGAGGAMAASVVAKAAPDGHTLLLQSAQFAIGAALRANLPYDPIKDFAGVAQIGFTTVVLVVAPSLGVKSARDFIALAQAKPGHVLFSSSGAGSATHMDCEVFRLAAGIKAAHVGMKSSPEALIEVVAGRVHFSMIALGPALPFIKEEKLLALAVANPQRSPLLPAVPAMVEVLPGYAREGSTGLWAPGRTPRAILNRISNQVRLILDLPDVKERLSAMGFVAAPTTPEQFDRIVRADIDTFRKIARFAGLTAK